MSLPEGNPAPAGRLPRLQEEFFHAVVRGGNCPAVTKTDGLAAYQLAYHLRLREALREDFPASFGLIPENALEPWLEEFFGSAPSTLYTLNAFGALWLEFLRVRSGELPPGLLELAEFEWELVLALYRDSAEFPELKVLELPATPPLRLSLARGLRLIRSGWPLAEMYEQEALLPASESSLAIWRAEGRAMYLRLDPMPFLLLEQLIGRGSWEEAVAGLPEDTSTAAELESALATLAAEGLLQVEA